MIFLVKDLLNNEVREAAVALTLAGMNTYRGYDCIVLSFKKADSVSAEKILYTKDNANEDDYFYVEKGMDVLMDMAEVGRLSKDDFTRAVTSLIKGKRFDVAALTEKTNFIESLSENKENVISLLRAADSLYDSVFILADDNAFEGYENEIDALVSYKLHTVSQYEKAERELKDAKDVIILCDYSSASSHNIKFVKNLYKNKNVLPFAYCVPFNDAVYDNKLALFIRKARTAYDDIASEFTVFTNSILGILDALSGAAKKADDVFSLLTGDEKSLSLLPLPQEVPETPVTKETKAKAETKQAKQKKSLFKKKNEEEL